MRINKTKSLILGLVLLGSCSTGVVSWKPESLTDTSDVVMTFDATKGNRALYNYKGDVYMHLGVITDLSVSPTAWQHIKFIWGAEIPQALAQPAGDNKWTYSIHNIRKFFEVPDEEKIMQMAFVLRGEGCRDSCGVLTNEDGSSIFIPVHNIDKP